MQRWRGLDAVPPGWGRSVVTVGVFDGVHRGHQQLIGTAVAAGRERGLPTVLVTFDPHPAEVVRPGSHPARLTSLRRQADLVAGLGVDAFLVLPFTTELSRRTPAEFAHEVLVERLHAAAVVVGRNFRFGHRAAGDVAALTELGHRFGYAVEGVELAGGIGRPVGQLGGGSGEAEQTAGQAGEKAGKGGHRRTPARRPRYAVIWSRP